MKGIKVLPLAMASRVNDWTSFANHLTIGEPTYRGKKGGDRRNTFRHMGAEHQCKMLQNWNKIDLKLAV